MSAGKMRFAASAGGLAIALAALTSGTNAMAQAAADDASETAQSDTIVVTATRRSESVLKVPVSVAALSQQNLDDRGIRTIQDIAAQTPGLNIAASAGSVGGMRASIRGINSTAGASTTATYIDDTPVQSRNSALNYSLSTFPRVFDLDRVEVLRGPQGTLFGASSMGGAIRFITPAPSLSGTSVYGRASFVTTDGGSPGGEVGLAIGAPIVEDKIGFRISAWYQHEGGYVDRASYQDKNSVQDNADSSNTYVLRAALALKPTEWLTITPSIYFQDQKINDTSYYWSSLSDTHAGVFRSGSSIPQPSHDRFWLPSLKIVADTGGINITSVTSHYARDVNEIRDQSQTNNLTTFGPKYLFTTVNGYNQVIDTWYSHTKQRDYVQEIRIQNSNPSRFNWLVGGYYSHSKIFSDPVLNSAYLNDFTQQYFGKTVAQYFGTGLVDGLYRYTGVENTTEEQFAGFVNVDWEFVKNLKLTVGGRYSSNKLVYDITERSPTYVTGVSHNAGSIKETPFTPKVSLSYDAGENLMFYSTYARGFRTGGVNKAVPMPACSAGLAALGLNGTPPTYNSDTTDSYELGSKGRIGGGLLSFEASVYQINWNNIQQSIRLTCAYPVTLNTGRARSRGFDINLNMRPTNNLRLGLTVGYNNAKYLDTLKSGTKATVFAGQKIDGTPWTLNGFFEYSFVYGGHDAYIRVQDTYNSRPQGPFGFQNPISSVYDPTRVTNEAMNKLDVRLGLKAGGVNWTLFSENLLNAHPILNKANLYAYAPFFTERTIRPRTIGLMATLTM